MKKYHTVLVISPKAIKSAASINPFLPFFVVLFCEVKDITGSSISSFKVFEGAAFSGLAAKEVPCENTYSPN